MRFVLGFFDFWYQLIIGDDWRVAVGVGVALVVGGLLGAYEIISGSALAVVVGVLIFGGFVLNLALTVLRQEP